ncbi:MAG: hypothetical protein COA80_07240 [Leeuwenhoekiella sp.]|nr:MAG: hypothetical protein COA80_07240 [Leeuwenhoekiella sp.]
MVERATSRAAGFAEPAPLTVFFWVIWIQDIFVSLRKMRRMGRKVANDFETWIFETHRNSSMISTAQIFNGTHGGVAE